MSGKRSLPAASVRPYPSYNADTASGAFRSTRRRRSGIPAGRIGKARRHLGGGHLASKGRAGLAAATPSAHADDVLRFPPIADMPVASSLVT